MTDYQLLLKQMKCFMEEEDYFIPTLSNAAALLWETLPDINWAGCYIVRDSRLVLGPFQGRPACIHIGKGKGVCGTAWAKDEVLLVKDVHAFPGHIACDPVSRSEIVLPLHADHKVVAVLDLDSPVIGRFQEEDKKGLMKFAALLEAAIKW